MYAEKSWRHMPAPKTLKKSYVSDKETCEWKRDLYMVRDAEKTHLKRLVSAPKEIF